jgi:hypothetical protein
MISILDDLAFDTKRLQCKTPGIHLLSETTNNISTTTAKTHYPNGSQECTDEMKEQLSN